MLRVILACGLVLACVHSATAAADSLGAYYVTVTQTDEHLGPAQAAQVTNTIYRQQKVDVTELHDGWARVSKYYDGTVEGERGRVARWVRASDLGRMRPADLPQPKVSADPRIQGIPKVGEDGLTKSDVQALYAGAEHFLKTGQCTKIEWGDKDRDANDRYYVNCGGPNLFFNGADFPKQ